MPTMMVWSPRRLRRWCGRRCRASAARYGVDFDTTPIEIALKWGVAPSACGLTAAACFLLMEAVQGSIVWTALLLAVASIGIFAILSLFWTIPSAMLEGSAAASGIALISSIASFAGAVCPAFVGWVSVATGRIYVALGAIGLLLAVGMLALVVGVPAPSGLSRPGRTKPTWAPTDPDRPAADTEGLREPRRGPRTYRNRSPSGA
jgi:hypothetical protein